MAKKTAGLADADIRRVVTGVMNELRSNASEQPPWMAGCPPSPPKMVCSSGETEVVTVYELVRLLDYIAEAAMTLKTLIEQHVPKSISWKSGCPPMPPKMTCVPHAAKKAAKGSPASRRRAPARRR